MTPGSIRGLKALLFLVCLVPLAKLALETFELAGLSLGANPIEELIHRFGIWGLNFLLITLAVTPLRWLTGWNWLIRFRRMLGLFAFFYVLMHFTTYAGLDQRFELAVILEDVVERPYITVGFSGAGPADSAGSHIHQWNDEAPGEALAKTASPGVPHCNSRCLALFLAGQTRYP